MMAVGSFPAMARMVASMEVVVVLPCVPAMAMENFMRMSSASISALGMTGSAESLAATHSGLSSPTADE